MTHLSPIEIAAPIVLSPLVLSHHLIDLAEDAGRAGLASFAERLINLAYQVLDAGCGFATASP
jgi:hypothetical protein